MNDAEKQFERIVAGLNIDDAADSRHKTALREQMLAAYAQSASSKSSRSVWQAWSKIMKSNINKTAAAAMILLAILLTWMALADKNDEQQIVGPTPEPQRQIAPDQEAVNNDIQVAQQAQLKLAEQLYEAQNVPALAALFEAGTTETKLAVANYLADLGTDEAFEALKLLDTSAEDKTVQQAVRKNIETMEKQQESQSAATGNPSTKPQPESEPPADKSTDNSETVAAVDTEKPAKFEEGFSIVLKVFDKETGQPIADADIRTYDGKSSFYKTDDNGVYVVTRPGKGPSSINLFAAKDGYVGQSFSVGEGRFIDYFPEEVVFKLEKGTTIGGIVTDSAGNPLEGIKVHFSINDGDGISKAPETDVRFEQKTDKDGHWVCTTAPEEIDWITVYADSDGYATSRSYVDKAEQIQQLREQTHVITMDAGYSVSGTVKDEAGNLIKGARVQIGEYYWYKDHEHCRHTDDNGYFEFKHLSSLQADTVYEEIDGQGKVPVKYPREYLTVSADGFAPVITKLLFKDNHLSTEIVLCPGSSIYGRVVNFEGQPVAGATVRANEWDDPQTSWSNHIRPFDWNTQTDADGRFVWQNAPAEEIQLVISKNDYLELETEKVTPSETEYEFVLNPRVRVTGQVVDALTKEPISEFIYRRHEGGTISSPKKIEHHEGRFETAFDDQGETFTISFEADGYKPTSSRKISLIEQDVELLIEMQPDAGIDGVVIDTNGKPLQDVRVMIPNSWMHIDNAKVEANWLRDIPNAVTDAQGRFHLDPVASKEYGILALDDTGYLFVASTDFPKDGRFVLQPYAKIVGTYYKGSKPAANERIRIDYPSYHYLNKGNGVIELGMALNYSVQTDEQGGFVFDKLIHGAARILIDPYQYVELKAGDVKEVHIGGDGLTVTGHLLNPAGKPLNEEFGDCFITLQPIRETLSIPQEEWPLPDNTAAMSYTELMTWFTEFSGSDEAQQWRTVMEKKYGDLGNSHSFDVDQNGRFEVPNVKSGTYLLSLTVRAWKDPDQFPRQRDYNNVIARTSVVVTVPAYEQGEDMDIPVDMGVLQSRKAPLAVGDIAPGFDIAKLKIPGRIRLSDYRGQTVLVNFTNPMLKDAEPDKAAMLETVCRQASAKAAIVNVAMELIPWETMRAKMRPLCTLPGVYGIAQMHHSKIYADYELGQIPQSVLIGPDGRILWKGEPDEELLETLSE